MPMMAKMRSLAPAFIITVGALFVLFMVISDSNVLEAIGGRSNAIGSVNGQEITYQEFQAALDRQIETQKNQTGQDPDENQIDQIRDQVWDAVVTQTLFNQLMEKYDITVSDDEIKEIILGEDPPPFLKQNFIDSTGNFNRELYEQALFDPRNKEALVQAEELVRQSRLSQKLQSIILASLTVNEDEVKRRFIDQNTNIEAEYVLFDVNAVPDNNVKVSDDDLLKYYEDNKNNYKLQPQRKLKFVLFQNVPSAEDSQIVKKTLESVLNKIQNDTAGFKDFVEIYSELPYSKDTLAVNSFTPEVIKSFNRSNTGAVVGPFATQQGYAIFHYLGFTTGKDEFARASHILINQYGSDEQNLEEANKLYSRLANGEDFSSLAKEFSKDPGSAQNGGDLGYFNKGMMVKEFEEAVFNGNVGEVQKPVKTSFGYHIIKVTDRSNKKYIVEKIVNQVKQSATTRDRVYNAANDFSYLADKNGFDGEATLMNYKIQESQLFTEQSVAVPGIGPNKRLVNFAFENSVNTVSTPFKLPNGFVVVQVSESFGERFTPFEDIKNSLNPIVVREKKFEILEKEINDISKKISGDLSKVASFKSGVQIQQTGNFTPSGTIPNIGRDYALINEALKLDIGKVSNPIKGARGYYLIKVTKRTPFDENAYSTQASTIKNTVLNEKRSRFLSQWVNELKENADITDNRHLFFGQ